MQGRLIFRWLLAAGLASAAFAAHSQRMVCQAPQGGLVSCPSPFDEAFSQWYEAERTAAENARREWLEDQISRDADYWGAIAVLAPTGDMLQLGFESQPQWAFDPLRVACNPRSGCDVLATYKNTCVAVARSRQGQMFFADDTQPQQAAKLAQQACVQAGSHACAVAEKEISCSGYRYIDAVTGEGGIGQRSLHSRLRKLKRDVGALSGSARIKPAMALYNPRLRQALQRPQAERAGLLNRDVRDDALWRRLDLTPPPDRWVAFAFSPSTGSTGLGMERDETGARVQARVNCEARDCEPIMSAHSGQCFAIVLQLSAQNRMQASAVTAASRDQAQRAGAQQCGAGAKNCQVGLVKCVD